MEFPSMSISRRRFVAGAGALAVGLRGGTVAQTPEPVAGIDFLERIGALFAAAPERGMPEVPAVPFSYADLAGQLEATGVERPDPSNQSSAFPPGFPEATMALPLASRPFQSGLDPAWFETFGFNPLAIGQALDCSVPPNVISIFAGGFDAEQVERALGASGYRSVRHDTSRSYWDYGDNLAPDTPVGRLGGGQMRHAMVSDGVLVFTEQEADVQAVTEVLAGQASSMAEQDLWAGMVTMFSPDTVGLMPVAPQALQASAPANTPSATPVAASPASIEHLAFGVRAGSRAAPLALVGEGTPEPEPEPGADPVPARVEARIWYGSEDAAAREAEAIPVRWTETSSLFTGEPYAELMTIEDARVSDQDARVVAIDFDTEVPNRWMQIIHTADFAPFLPPPPVG